MQPPGTGPLGFSGHGRQQIAVSWTVRDVLIASGAVVGSFLGAVLFLSFAISRAGGSEEWFENGEVFGLPAPLVLAVILEVFFLGAVVLFSGVKDWSQVRRLGFIHPTGRAPYALAFAAWFAGLVASGTWIFLTQAAGIGWLQPPDSAAEVLNYSGGALVFPIIVIGIITPICEETFFRGFALPAFARRYGVWGGILLSAALFSIFHFSIGLVVPVFIFGIVLGWLYVRTGSIYPSITAHAVQNVVALLAAN